MAKRPRLVGGAQARIKPIESIKDLTPDTLNTNLGTERGLGLLEHSLRRYGVGRPIFTDREGRVIGGNKTLEQAIALGITEVQVVRTRGDVLVVHVREDLDLEDEHSSDARELAVADNRIAEVDLDYSVPNLRALRDKKDTDLTAFWTEDELADLLAPDPRDQPVEFEASGKHCTCCEKKCQKGCKCYGKRRTR